VVCIRRGDDGAVGEQLKAGLETVFEGLQHTHAIMAEFVIKRVFFRTLR
jgi:hypothetical protein